MNKTRGGHTITTPRGQGPRGRAQGRAHGGRRHPSPQVTAGVHLLLSGRSRPEAGSGAGAAGLEGGWQPRRGVPGSLRFQRALGKPASSQTQLGVLTQETLSAPTPSPSYSLHFNCKRYRLLLHALLSPRLCLYLTRPILHLSQPCTCPGRQVGSSRPLLPLCCPHTPGLFLLNF